MQSIPDVYPADESTVARDFPGYLNSDRTHTTIKRRNTFAAATKEVHSEA